MFKRLLTRLRILRGGRADNEVDEELRFHLQQQVEANVAAGMSVDEARRQALLVFG